MYIHIYVLYCMYICIYILYGGVRARVINEVTESEQMGNGKK